MLREENVFQLSGTVSEEDAELRESIFRYALESTDPRSHEDVRHLFSRWEEWNERFFGGVLVPAVILLNGPEATTCYGDCSTESGFGCGSQIRLRPSILKGTLQHLRKGNKNRAGLRRFLEDVLLHEMIHQWTFECLPREAVAAEGNNYNGHGPMFSGKANVIGEQLGLPPVRPTNKARGKNKDLPSPSQWPHNVRPLEYYMGAYVPTSRDEDAWLRQQLCNLLRKHGIDKVNQTALEVWQIMQESEEAEKEVLS